MPLSQNHAKYLRSLLHKKYRDSEQKYLVEGVRLCNEALSAEAPVREFIIARDKLSQELPGRLLERAKHLGIPVFVAEERDFHSIADTESPQGVACVMKKKPAPAQDWYLRESTLLVGLEAIRDPGNLGTIIRTADWFGIDGMLLNNDTVDVYNPKVVRASMGSIFRMRISEQVVFTKKVPEFKKAGFSLSGTIGGGGMPLQELKRAGRQLVLIGSEANGLDSASLELADMKVTIPKVGAGESLNAAIAAGIILYHLTTKEQSS